MDKLEQLLQQSLPPINDDGFTEKVLQQVKHQQAMKFRFWLTTYTLVLISMTVFIYLVLFKKISSSALVAPLASITLPDMTTILSNSLLMSSQGQAIMTSTLITIFTLVAMYKGSQLLR